MLISYWSSDVCSSDLLLTALIARQQQIQVQRARAPTLAVAGTAVLSFDSEQCVEQGARGQGRLQMRCGVDEIGLLGVAPGRRQVIRRYAYQPGLRQCSQRGQSGGKGRWYIAQIGRASWRERVCQYV